MNMSTAIDEVFRSELDKTLCNDLAPLIEHGVEIRVPFFANTFPLAFHYASILESNRGTSRQLNHRIKFISWAKETSQFRRSKGPPLVYYSTEDKAPTDEQTDTVCVTDFQPRWIFSEFNLTIWAERTRLAKNLGMPSESTEIEFGQISHTLKDVHFFEVFTEIPTQAKALFPLILKGCKQHLEPSYLEPQKAHSILPMGDHLRNNTLRFFLYGAPLTSYFLRKRQRYIPFKVDKLNSAESSFRTVVVVRGGDENKRKQIIAALGRYHSNLYKTANAELKDDRLNFRAVQYNYNRIARLLQHRSSFPSSIDYAKCLDAHHKNPIETNQPTAPHA